jgi:hypothetical protein
VDRTTKPKVTPTADGGARVVADTGAWKSCAETLNAVPYISNLRRLDKVRSGARLLDRFPRVSKLLKKLPWRRSKSVDKELDKPVSGWRKLARHNLKTGIDGYVDKLEARFVENELIFFRLKLENIPAGPAFRNALPSAGEKDLYDHILAGEIKALRRAKGGGGLTGAEAKTAKREAKRKTIAYKEKAAKPEFEAMAKKHYAGTRERLKKLLLVDKLETAKRLAKKIHFPATVRCHSMWTPKIVLTIRPDGSTAVSESGSHSHVWQIKKSN